MDNTRKYNLVAKKPITELNRLRLFEHYYKEVFIEYDTKKKGYVRKYKDEDIYITVEKHGVPTENANKCRLSDWLEKNKDNLDAKKALFLLPVISYKESYREIEFKEPSQYSYSVKPNANSVMKRCLFITLKYLPVYYVLHIFYKKYFINDLIYDHIIDQEEIQNKVTVIGTEAYGLIRNYVDKMFNRDTYIKHVRKQALVNGNIRYLKSSDSFVELLFKDLCLLYDVEHDYDIKIIPSIRKDNLIDYYIIQAIEINK